ncbi:uncharacterized protein LACBIDRAFT_292578 [Laccaria bicolor S238N-H82]|uniref:Predicted protein n=1 Tax=Laccaria bicolor (strain S238N-H82 / ATCC MYA-4686) TaxID=486041 RepID=B0CVP7_LACBS|nr:uncharacterized protein LACBIDRAFT_292578 [Laccaria bicolor S238N-H82]EDR13367.1 predicted protein [Laccaria bicolor S238N-H82]|eukprot:XP_001875865.1 predicted protein [Laccaria bicolor S238N-H82]
MRVEEGFQPVPFQEENTYTSDPVLPDLLKRTLPPSVFQQIEPDLIRLGGEIITSIRSLGDGNKISPPILTQYDQWGRRVDNLQTSEGWRDLKAVAQKEGIPGIFYERKFKEHSRVYGFAKMMMMVGDTHEVFCPLSMTDGSARVIELIGTPEMKKKILPRLISRDPSFAFTSGQWMTERPGGSDVSRTETTAVDTGKSHSFGPKYSLNGFKWFSSATDSEVSVALARTGTAEDGSRGLSLFLVPLRLPLLRERSDPPSSPVSNNIFVHRLKNKIGTHALPTAELTLTSTEAYLMGEPNQGIKNITPVLNITRLWSAATSVGNLRKCLSIATAYAKVRSIKGGSQLLQDTPIHVAQLASINLLYRALTHLTFGVISLLGKSECGVATTDELRRLRMLTPAAKAFAAEKACAGMEEAMAALGGAGYMEENGIGRSIRDALVEKIWEGTVVVLALDLARSAQDRESMESFTSWANRVISSAASDLQEIIQRPLDLLKNALEELRTAYTQPLPPLIPRPALMLVASIASSVYLLEHAIWSRTTQGHSSEVDVEVFRRWVLEGGTAAAIEDVKKAKEGANNRIDNNFAITFGNKRKARM